MYRTLTRGGVAAATPECPCRLCQIALQRSSCEESALKIRKHIKLRRRAQLL
jgi:hypothetical protein